MLKKLYKFETVFSAYVGDGFTIETRTDMNRTFMREYSESRERPLSKNVIPKNDLRMHIHLLPGAARVCCT